MDHFLWAIVNFLTPLKGRLTDHDYRTRGGWCQSASILQPGDYAIRLLFEATSCKGRAKLLLKFHLKVTITQRSPGPALRM